MATKTKEQSAKDSLVEDTAAADTLKAKPSDASKASMMATAMGAMAGMDSAACSKWLDQALALIGHEADAIPDDASAKNQASIAMKGAIKEDVAALFGSEELSEEFKEKASTLFEAALNARVLAERAIIEEELDAKLNEEVEHIVEALTENVDQYISYAAETWAKENEVAIEKSLRADIAESFISGFFKLCSEHNVYVPEDKVDVVEALATEVETLKSRLNEAVRETIDLNTILEAHTKEKVFSEVSSGLALTQVDKLKSLCEGVEFIDPENYRKKVETIKEGFINAKRSEPRPTSFITEDLETPEPEAVVPPEVASYVKAISRTVKK